MPRHFEQPDRLAIVIPAYRPSDGLADLVRTLSERAAPAIVIVDDGSGPEYRDVFSRAAAFPNVQLLRHAVNLGKGAALKTAFNHVLCTFPALAGIVTADADGQHHPDDIQRVADRLMAQPESLILGSRSFDRDVPLRSRVGNVATRGIMHGLLGQKLTDTQTGLRGIPASFLPKLLRHEATGYEF
ncbi:MAG TPA: glycosyltransferase family 2 protein, partial [Bryobacteraceae bacterium]|nr:glycosyltransferase family 2 protein [Bryobacteraceae bacterium]